MKFLNIQAWIKESNTKLWLLDTLQSQYSVTAVTLIHAVNEYLQLLIIVTNVIGHVML